MAALDKRLQAHQEAFTQWRGLMGKTHTNEIGGAVNICQAWWVQNCVYLEPDVRSAFVDAYSAALIHNQLVQSRQDQDLVKENWRRITMFPDLLFKAVQLPALSPVEIQSLELNARDGASNETKPL